MKAAGHEMTSALTRLRATELENKQLRMEIEDLRAAQNYIFKLLDWLLEELYNQGSLQ